MIERISSFERFLELEEEWDQLVGEGTYYPYQTHFWHRVWLESFDLQERITIYLKREDGRLVGIAPFYRSQKQGLDIIGGSNYFSDYTDLILSGKNQKEIGEELMEAVLSDTELISVTNIRQDSFLYSFLKNNSSKSILDYLYEAPYLHLSKRDKGEKNGRVKRGRKKLEKVGKLSFEFLVKEREVLEELFKQHIERWGNTRTPSLFLDQKNKRFFRELLNGPDWIVLSKLTAGNNIVALHLGFLYKGRFIWYKPSFDLEYSNCSPGQILISELVIGSKKKGVEIFDFSCGSEKFKLDYSDDTVSVYEGKIFRSHLLRYLVLFRRFLRRALSPVSFLLKPFRSSSGPI